MSNELDFEDFDLDFKVTPKKQQVVGGAAVEKTEDIPNAPEISLVSPKESIENLSDAQLSIVAKAAAKKLLQIGSELKQLFVERDSVIADALRALAIGQHILLLGPPGTGKSMIAREICSRIEQGKFFEWLLNRTSDPAEILGPFSIKGMERDKFLRKTDGKLPEADIVFLDEVYKANEPTLNILLPLLNERIFFNDGKAVEVPLITLFAASNETSDDDSLKALHDRLVFRHMVNYVQDPANRSIMQQNYVAKRNGKAINKTTTTITVDELIAIRECAAKIPVQKGVYKTFAKLINILAKEGIVVSDRRQNECFKIMQGNAMLMGRSEVVLDDIGALKFVLWEKDKDILLVESEIDKLINPFDDEIKGYIRKVAEIEDSINAITNPSDKCGAVIEAKGRLEDIIKKMDKTIKDASNNGKDVSYMNSERDRIVKLNQKLMEEALGLNLGSMTGDVSEGLPF